MRGSHPDIGIFSKTSEVVGVRLLRLLDLGPALVEVNGKHVTRRTALFVPAYFCRRARVSGRIERLWSVREMGGEGDTFPGPIELVLGVSAQQLVLLHPIHRPAVPRPKSPERYCTEHIRGTLNRTPPPRLSHFTHYRPEGLERDVGEVSAPQGPHCA